MRKALETEDEGFIWEKIAKNYEFIDGAQISPNELVISFQKLKLKMSL